MRLVPVRQPLKQQGHLICVGGLYDGQWVPDTGLTVNVWDGQSGDTAARYHRMLIEPSEGTPATYAHCYIAEGLHPDEASRRLLMHLTRPGPATAAELSEQFSPKRSIPNAKAPNEK